MEEVYKSGNIVLPNRSKMSLMRILGALMRRYCVMVLKDLKNCRRKGKQNENLNGESAWVIAEQATLVVAWLKIGFTLL